MKAPVKIYFVILLFSFITSTSAWAVQTHGGSEGLVSHEIAHLLFAFGMGYLLFRLYRIHINGPGWIEFKCFLWLIIIWNILAFSAHWMDEFVLDEQFVQSNGKTVAFIVFTLKDGYFYFTRLDHLILVPSFIFLLLALRKWRMQQ